MSFKRLYPDESLDKITKGFPPYLQDAIFKWIRSHVLNYTPRPAVLNMRYTAISDDFNSKISSAFRRKFGDSLEQHFAEIRHDTELTADYVNYLLQVYPDEYSANSLRDILQNANSEYEVYIKRARRQLGNGISQPTPRDIESIYLGFRTSAIVTDQLDNVADRDRLQRAWRDLYDASHQDYASVVQKSLDELAGAIRDRLYPNDTKTNLTDYSKRIERDIDKLDLPAKDKMDWTAIIKSLANFVDLRGVHNTGTDSDPEKTDALATLHLSIALVTILRSES